MTDDVLEYRYDAKMASKIENKWQKYWDDNGTFRTPNPGNKNFDSNRQPYVIMDMFPYPSGAGLHVGHPLGYIATDVLARYMRMNSHNVLHALGFDAFGLPAEQYAIQTGKHPEETTKHNIKNMCAQLKMLGLAHDPDRTFATTDAGYVRWTQWIFSKIYNSYFDEEAQNPSGSKGSARPISELVEKLKSSGVWDELESDKARSEYLNKYRLAYISESEVNWCPGLGTVLANEEVTVEGKSERGNFPVFKKKFRQWSMRITAYANRLTNDLDLLDWPDKIKYMQKNWIGKSTGSFIDFKVEVGTSNSQNLRVFTTRPDTIRGASFMVVAPEHPICEFTHKEQKETAVEYINEAKKKSATQRQQDAGKKSGAFLGLYGTNPITAEKLPIFVADYVLMGYGTGAIMAVPADDERDEEFANTYGIEFKRDYEKFTTIDDAIKVLENAGCGEKTTTYRLRDWLFSRQRYWGEPFPIIYDEEGIDHLLPDELLPVLLPDVPDYSPKVYAVDDENSIPEAPLSRNDSWVNIELDLGDGKGVRKFRRETNTMPNWAGSCWYYLRYLDVNHAGSSQNASVVDPKLEKYWLGPEHNSTASKTGGVDLYVGGVEHAVLHLLYARFWHKILYDLGFVSSVEPFKKLFNQGYIQAYAYTDKQGQYVDANEVEEVKLQDNQIVYKFGDEVVNREYGKMGKNLKNIITPEEVAHGYGADTFRIYEMSMGPLDLSRPWETRAVVGAMRFLQRLWRLVVDENTGSLVDDLQEVDTETLKVLNKTVDSVRVEMENIRLNTAIAKLIGLVNHLTGVLTNQNAVPRSVVKPLILMTAPFAPHICEELWQRLGETISLLHADYPSADEKYLVDDTIKIGVQVNGKVRATLEIASTASVDEFKSAALSITQVANAIGDKDIKKAIVIPGKIVNFVV
ncbi:MAG: leucine--tRNA ligase [Candidatus Ancillula trichonymphae]|jgi:leucyl-tRNA synthetase|nr:leucine--tRNA ligase [Candidatus Ancillula trichonymphae]